MHKQSTRVITNRQIAAAIRFAMANKTLQAQQGYQRLARNNIYDKPACAYRTNLGSKECYCAIGAALTPHERVDILMKNVNGKGVYTLIEEGIVTFEDRTTAARLQSLHDLWTQESCHRVRNLKRHRFLAAVARVEKNGSLH
jgi:hypothetical protein